MFVNDPMCLPPWEWTLSIITCYLFAIVDESFKDYVAVEMLEGENKYDAEKYGLQVSLPSSL